MAHDTVPHQRCEVQAGGIVQQCSKRRIGPNLSHLHLQCIQRGRGSLHDSYRHNEARLVRDQWSKRGCRDGVWVQAKQCVQGQCARGLHRHRRLRTKGTQVSVHNRHVGTCCRLRVQTRLHQRHEWESAKTGDQRDKLLRPYQRCVVVGTGTGVPRRRRGTGDLSAPLTHV